MTFRSLITLVALTWVLSNFLTHFHNGRNHSWTQYFSNSVIKAWSKNCSIYSSVVFSGLSQWHIFDMHFDVIWMFCLVWFGFLLWELTWISLSLWWFWIPFADKAWTMSRGKFSGIMVNAEGYPWFAFCFKVIIISVGIGCNSENWT